MNAIVIYKSKYGATQKYAEWISEALGCDMAETKKISVKDLEGYDTIILGGGLYAEIIAGVSLITKNFDRLSDKKLIVYTCGITPIDCREYYETYVSEKNFKPHMLEKIKVFNFNGRMVLSELTPVHRAALKTLKKIMTAKTNPTEMEKLLVELCDADGDFTDKEEIKPLLEYAIS